MDLICISLMALSLSAVCKGMLKSSHQEYVGGKLAIMLESSCFIIMEEVIR